MNFNGLQVTSRDRAFKRVMVFVVACMTASVCHADTHRPPRVGHRSLVVDRLSHNFGAMGQHQKSTATFTYTNKGTKTVTGIVARGECGCNKVNISMKSLRPGESGTLTTEFHTLFLHGTIKKSIRLSSKDRRDGTVRIAQHVSVVKGLIQRDASVHFGDMAAGSSPTHTIAYLWHQQHGTPFKITAVEVPGHDMTTVVEDFVPKADQPWRGYTVRYAFGSPPPIGMFSAESIVRTDHPDHARITLPISAHVCGPVWIQSRRITLGSVLQGQARTASVKLRPFDPAKSFGAVTAKARLGKVRVEVKKDPYHGDKGFWRLYVSIPPTAAAGTLNDEVIEVRTGMPEEPLTLVRVSGRVRAPSKRREAPSASGTDSAR